MQKYAGFSPNIDMRKYAIILGCKNNEKLQTHYLINLLIYNGSNENKTSIFLVPTVIFY